MPKFYKQNKKRIDPRYFMGEKLEEAVIEPEAGQFPGVSPADRAKDLATQGMERQISGEIPPWEAQDEEGDGLTDASLDEKDFEVLEWILNDLKQEAQLGRGQEMAEKFSAVMEKLGISLQGESGTDTEGTYTNKEEDVIRKSVLGSMAKNPPSTPWSKGR